MAFPISKYIIWPFFSIFIKKIEGLKNITDKPCVLVCNHSSYVDAVLVVFMIAWHKNKKVRSIATKKYFTGFFWNMLFRWAGAIRVNGSVDKAVDALKKGDYVVIFPEGGRTFTGEISEVKNSGAGMMALLAKVPLIPVAMNTFNWWGRHHMLPNFKRNINLDIGKAKYFNLKPTKANARKVVRTMMKEVKRLRHDIT